ncbi:MAG: cation:proton antiporter, partial [Anaerolineaceae bacterium]|nr:cation:proton antiporter [Anaerolineaceae bacterium]
GTGGFAGISAVFLRMVFFLGTSVLFGIYFLPMISRSVSKLPISQGTVTIALIFLLVYGVSAELFGGMAAITGAFLAGLMFGRTTEKQVIETSFRTLAYTFFVPVFFINIGLTINIKTLGANSIWLLVLLSIIAILGKILGAGLGARLARFSWLESLQLGIGMVSRGEVGLIVAKVGLDQGLLTPQLFSIIVGIVLVTTLVTPPLLRYSFTFKEKNTPSPTPSVLPSKEIV